MFLPTENISMCAHFSFITFFFKNYLYTYIYYQIFILHCSVLEAAEEELCLRKKKRKNQFLPHVHKPIKIFWVDADDRAQAFCIKFCFLFFF